MSRNTRKEKENVAHLQNVKKKRREIFRQIDETRKKSSGVK